MQKGEASTPRQFIRSNLLRSMRHSLRALVALCALPLLAGCEAAWGTDPSVSLKLNGNYVMGNESITRYTASPTPEIVLSRSLNGSGMTAFFRLPDAPQAGTYPLVDGTTTAVSTSPIVVGTVDSRRAEARPAAASHRIDSGTLTLVSVSPEKVTGTFTATIRTSADAPAQEFTGRFAAFR